MLTDCLLLHSCARAHLQLASLAMNAASRKQNYLCGKYMTIYFPRPKVPSV